MFHYICSGWVFKKHGACKLGYRRNRLSVRWPGFFSQIWVFIFRSMGRGRSIYDWCSIVMIFIQKGFWIRLVVYISAWIVYSDYRTEEKEECLWCGCGIQSQQRTVVSSSYRTWDVWTVFQWTAELCKLVGVRCEAYQSSAYHKRCLVQIGEIWYVVDPTNNGVKNCKAVDYAAERDRYKNEYFASEEAQKLQEQLDLQKKAENGEISWREYYVPYGQMFLTSKDRRGSEWHMMNMSNFTTSIEQVKLKSRYVTQIYYELTDANKDLIESWIGAGEEHVIRKPFASVSGGAAYTITEYCRYSDGTVLVTDPVYQNILVWWKWRD